MDEVIRFDHAQADKLRSKLTNKTKTIQMALCRIEGLVERTANLHWEGKSRTEYIGLYKSSCAQAHNYLRKWLKEITDLINRAKEEKEKQEKPESIQKPRQLIEHLPDNAFKYVAGPAAMADGQTGSGAAIFDSSLNERAEITEREMYYALVQSYAGPADNGRYMINEASPDEWLDSLTWVACLIKPEQLEVYNSVVASGSYTDEQKRRMMISIALGTNINDLLNMDEYDKADALVELMDRWKSQSIDVYNRFLVMLDIKWSAFPDINESIVAGISRHFEKLMFPTSSAPSTPSMPSFNLSFVRIIDAFYQNLPRRYDAVLDKYNIPESIKKLVNVLINYGGTYLDGLAITVCNLFMLYEADREAESNLFDSEENKRINSAICEGPDGKEAFIGIIDDQETGAASQIQMGTKPGSVNGCGWVATYNTMFLLGRKMQPWEIVEFYEETGGLLFAGAWGINPEGIRKFFKSQGIKTNIDYFAVNLDEQIKKSGVAIYNYLHSTGAHYVTVEYKDGLYTIYNAGGSGAGETVKSFDEWVENKNQPVGILPLSLITF